MPHIMSAIAIPQQRQFNPYTENGGTILAVAGADFTVIAGDTRQSEGYNIQTRYAPKVFRLFVPNSLSHPLWQLTRHLVGPTALYWP
jgi:Proteasome subunit